jgi:hypothetical protein
MGSALFGVHFDRRHLAAHPADRADQVGHGVMGGDRIVEDRGIHRPARLADQHPGRGDDRLTASKIRSGPIQGRQTGATSTSTRWHETPHRWPRVRTVFHSRSKVTASTVALLDSPCHACNVITSATTARAHSGGLAQSEQVRERLVRKQTPPMRGQQPEHAARLEQMPRHRVGVKSVPLIVRAPYTSKSAQRSAIKRRPPHGVIQESPGGIGALTAAWDTDGPLPHGSNEP